MNHMWHLSISVAQLDCRCCGALNEAVSHTVHTTLHAIVRQSEIMNL